MRLKTKFLFVLILSSLCLYSLVFTLASDGAITVGDNPKLSQTSVSINIFGNSGWVDFKNDGNCTGEGTYLDPYLIEDLIIDGDGDSYCIHIQNSDVYFRIENCTLYNSGAGIRLIQVKNGYLNNNSCTSNDNGISLSQSDNNTITNNILLLSHSNAINLEYYCDKNILSNNTIMQSNVALYLSTSCNNNTILRNNISQSDFNAIYLWSAYSSDEYCANNTISKNIITGATAGIEVWGIDTLIHDNTIKNCINGIEIKNDDSVVQRNTIMSCSNGIYLTYNSQGHEFSHNNITDGGTGIFGLYSNSSIFMNVISNMSGEGIWLRNGANNNFSKNSIVNSNFGIYLREGNAANNFTENSMYGCGLYVKDDYELLTSNFFDSTNTVNDHPIYFYANKEGLTANDFFDAGQVIIVNCNNSFISDIQVSDLFNGIGLYYSHNNTISSINAHHNVNGIYMNQSHSNIIQNSNFDNNEHGMILYDSVKNHVVNNHLANNLENGLSLVWSSSNFIINNEISYNINGIFLNNDHEVDFEYSCDRNIIKENAILSNTNGIWLEYKCVGNVINRNIIKYNDIGIKLIHSCNANNITGNLIDFNFEGINFWHLCYNSIIFNNTIAHCSDGIAFYLYCRFNTISRNNITLNTRGLLLDNSHANTITDNSMLGNEQCIVEIESEDNIFENNDCGDAEPTEPSILGFPVYLILISGLFSILFIFKRLKHYVNPSLI